MNIPLKETIDYIIHKINNENLLNQCAKVSYSSNIMIQFNQSFYK